MPETAYHQFKLRMPKGLFDRLAVSADISNRSVSSEIISRLEQSFEGDLVFSIDGQEVQIDLTTAFIRAVKKLDKNQLVALITEELAAKR